MAACWAADKITKKRLGAGSCKTKYETISE